MGERDDGRGQKAPAPPRHTSGQGPSGPAHGGSSSAPASGGSKSGSSVPKSPDPSIDPELVEDLGPELELRGDQVEAELEAARAEAAECRDVALRAQAEFENFRKRITREREEERRRAGERVVTEILPALDNLERAIEHTTAGGDLKHLLAGVEAVHAQILGVLAKEGVEVVDPLGGVFDPITQQAVSQKEDPQVPEGTVVEVFHKGYSLGGRVLRSAMVVVSTGGPAPEE